MLDWLFVGFLKSAATTVTRVYPRHPLGRRIKVNTRSAAGALPLQRTFARWQPIITSPSARGRAFARRAASLV